MNSEKLDNKERDKLFKSILSRPFNKVCADCSRKNPKWYSLNWGVLICIQCSGIHRSFGVHINRVKSTKLDGWTVQEICQVEGIGNQAANSYWEHGLKYKSAKPRPNRSEAKANEFIKQKYLQRIWAPGEEILDPVNEYNLALQEGREPRFGDQQEEISEEEDEQISSKQEPRNIKSSAVSSNPFGFIKNDSSQTNKKNLNQSNKFNFLGNIRNKKVGFSWNKNNKKNDHKQSQKKNEAPSNNPFGFLSKQSSKNQQPDLR